jgi:hypothetical protein
MIACIILLNMIIEDEKNTDIAIDSFYFFFGHVHTREWVGRIRTSDIRFIRRGSQAIELPLGVLILIFKYEQINETSHVLVSH